MKKNIFKLMSLFCLLCGCVAFSACDDDEWGNDNAEKMNEFFFGFQDWGQLKNDVVFTVSQGSTVEIPSLVTISILSSTDRSAAI